ncbi:helix-turn-helix domain-containing protein [Mycetocola sp. BIGb0189]|uniref:helix-turn-helix domain-containing protein n=1 Tax=Mycetocola sp. BIGb0189 TaxID=2940604 RepID=UPI0021688146|nr:helix-turn-helix transcriptional regulator [Mycetocola sp. BIGb0189]
MRVRAGLTQAERASRIGVGQRQVSKIEHGELDNARARTIRRYLEAVGREFSAEFIIGDEHVRVA